MGASPFKVKMGSGYTVAVDTTQAHSGTKSIHISAPTATGAGALTETKTFSGATATDWWGRVFFRFKAPADGHQMFIAVNVSGNQFRLFNTLGSTKIQLNDQKADKFTALTQSITMEKWFCYEWHMTPTTTTAYVDGQQGGMVSWAVSGATSLQIGYERFQAAKTAGEIWIDDVAIGTSQIGCD